MAGGPWRTSSPTTGGRCGGALRPFHLSTRSVVISVVLIYTLGVWGAFLALLLVSPGYRRCYGCSRAAWTVPLGMALVLLYASSRSLPGLALGLLKLAMVAVTVLSVGFMAIATLFVTFTS